MDEYDEEIMLSQLKELEAEYESMMYFNNFPPDMHNKAMEWVKKRNSPISDKN